ncbi:MATE family efflux transporter [bacterium]|nr:MATE family efflux transporter [bacterium]
MTPSFFPSSTRRKQIVKLALPIIFGMLSINIVDIVDTAMIGQLGDKALAGTGFASFLFFVCFAMLVGLGATIQTFTSRCLGEQRHDECALPLTAGLIIMIGYTIPVTVIMIIVAPLILGLFSSDPQVIEFAVTYFRWRVLGLGAIGCSLCFRGFWNGIKQPNTYVLILMATHVLNIGFNWILIFGHLGFPAMGVKGAAIGSTLSLSIGAIAYIIYTLYKKASLHILKNMPKPTLFRSLLSISGPASIDQGFFALYLLTFFWLVGQLGTASAAIAHVVITCVLVLYLPGAGLGMTSLSLVSESLGKGAPKDAKQWAWDIIKCGIPIIMGVGIILFYFPKLILSQFIHSPSTLELAIFPLRLDLLTLWTACIGVIIIESLTGAGATRTVMIIKIISRWVFIIPGIYIMINYLNYGIHAIWVYWVAINFIETLTFIGIWQREQWMKVQLHK